MDCPLLWIDIHIPMEPYDPLVFFERSAPALFNVTFNSVWTQDMDIHPQVFKGNSQQPVSFEALDDRGYTFR